MRPLPPLVRFPRRITEADGICSVGASSTKVHRKAILPRDTDNQFIADLKAAGSSVATTRT